MRRLTAKGIAVSMDFANSLLDQMKVGRMGAGQTESAKHKQNLKTTLDEVVALRHVGVAWLDAHGSEIRWQGMTMPKLYSTVFGWSFECYNENSDGAGKRRRGVIACAWAGVWL